MKGAYEGKGPARVEKPWRCLCLGLEVQSTQTRPRRFTVLQYSHSFLTDERTFIVSLCLSLDRSTVKEIDSLRFLTVWPSGFFFISRPGYPGKVQPGIGPNPHPARYLIQTNYKRTVQINLIWDKVNPVHTEAIRVRFEIVPS